MQIATIHSPSFRECFAATDDSPHQVAATESPEQATATAVADDDDDYDYDFEFAFMASDPDSVPDITADEIFANGQILPIFPLFNQEKPARLPLRQLMIEDREICSRSGSASSSSSTDDLEGVSPEIYCPWAPGSVKKSGSTGSASRRWRLIDMVVGRSHSDGKKKIVFFAADEKEKKGKGKERRVSEVDMVTAHRVYYGKNGGRRSLLPEQRDLVGGFFANVSGLSRGHQPF